MCVANQLEWPSSEFAPKQPSISLIRTIQSSCPFWTNNQPQPRWVKSREPSSYEWQTGLAISPPNVLRGEAMRQTGLCPGSVPTRQTGQLYVPQLLLSSPHLAYSSCKQLSKLQVMLCLNIFDSDYRLFVSRGTHWVDLGRCNGGRRQVRRKIEKARHIKVAHQCKHLCLYREYSQCMMNIVSLPLLILGVRPVLKGGWRYLMLNIVSLPLLTHGVRPVLYKGWRHLIHMSIFQSLACVFANSGRRQFSRLIVKTAQFAIWSHTHLWTNSRPKHDT